MLNREQANRCIEVTFSSNDYRLKGVPHLPSIKSPPVVIGSHGLLSNRDSPKQIELAHRCNANGIAYFRYIKAVVIDNYILKRPAAPYLSSGFAKCRYHPVGRPKV